MPRHPPCALTRFFHMACTTHPRGCGCSPSLFGSIVGRDWDEPLPATLGASQLSSGHYFLVQYFAVSSLYIVTSSPCQRTCPPGGQPVYCLNSVLFSKHIPQTTNILSKCSQPGNLFLSLLSTSIISNFCGATGIRTPDPLLAKQVL